MRFDARVLGIPTHLGIARKHLPRTEFAHEQTKLEAAETALGERFPDRRIVVADFFRRPGPCISHVQCERFDFLRPLHDFACFLGGTTVSEVIQENAWTDYPHVVLMGAADSMVVPFDFTVPMQVRIPGRPHPYMVCSGPHIIRELDKLDEYVAIRQTIGIHQFDAFVMLRNSDMERFEKRQGVGRRFWAKWGVAALRGLVSRAHQSLLPVLIDPQHSNLPTTE